MADNRLFPDISGNPVGWSTVAPYRRDSGQTVSAMPLEDPRGPLERTVAQLRAYDGPYMTKKMLREFLAAGLSGPMGMEKVARGRYDVGDLTPMVNDLVPAMLPSSALSLTSAPAANALLTLGGRNSLTFPHDKLRFAEKMERAGARPETIWKGYGLMRDKAGNWRYEIPDEGMRLWVTDGYPATREQAGFFTKDGVLAPTTYTTPNFGPKTKISDVMEHPELFRAYPHLADTQIRHMPLFSQADGMYLPDSKAIAIAGNHLETLPKVMAHELQHGIQHFEEVPIGGNPQQYLPKNFAKDQQDLELLRKKFEDALTRTGRPSKDLYELPYLATTNSARAKRIMGLIQQDDPEFYKLLQAYAKKELKLREQKNTAYDAYRSLAGEQEAEAVANRIHLDRRGRVEIPFWNNFTVPMNNQLLGDVIPW